MNEKNLQEILKNHELWLETDGREGKRADLPYANLSHANLSHANLSVADLTAADLSNADLSGTDLSHANLWAADLSRANLTGANLSVASLYKADLSGADLSGANLSEANLSSANLTGANLSGANLKNVKWNAITAFFDLQCPEKGSFVAYKKCRDGVIVELLIPKDAKRSSATSRKCRCDKAVVLEIVDGDGNQIETAVSKYFDDFIYKVGKTVKVDSFDENRWVECSTGIHFFMTRAEAENY